MNTGKKKVFAIALGLLVSVLLAEATSWVALKVFFAGHSGANAELASDLRKTRLAGLELGKSWRQSFRRFPLFGYVYSDGNNFGFQSPLGYPPPKGPDDFVIGLVGASVSRAMGLFLEDHPELVEDLKRRLPELMGKHIIFMDLSVAGYRQPQQFFVFSYFLDSLDALIQIDGWNEVWISGANSYPIDFPAFSEVFYSEDRQVIDLLDRLAKVKWLFDGGLEMAAKHPLTTESATFRLVLLALRQYLTDGSATIQDLGAQAGLRKPFYRPGLNESEELALRIKSWEKYLRLEHQLAEAKGLKTFFFIQPSQYAEGAKVFTDSEKAKALAPNMERPSRWFAELRRRAAEDLKGIPLFDLHGIYAKEAGDIFIDTCCHVNERGREILSREVLETVFKNWSTAARPLRTGVSRGR